MTGEVAVPSLDEMGMDRAVARMWKLMWAMAAGGAIVFLAWRGWQWGVGWILGTAVSALNFRWLKQLTEAIGGEAAKPRKAVFLGMRYLLLGGSAYVILKYSAISLPAALSGLFVSVAAVALGNCLAIADGPKGTMGSLN